MGRVTPDYLTRFAVDIDRADADAIFLSCGGIRSVEVADEIEKLTQKPVITSNQAQMWSCLRRAGIYDPVSGFGQIFQREGRSLGS
jgi:maleate isomerase